MIDSLHLTQLCPHEAVEHADLKLSNRLPLQVLGVFSALQRLCLAVLGKARHKTAILQDMQDLQMRRLRSLMRCRADLEQAESDVLHVSCMLAKEALVHDTQLQSRFLRLVKSDKVPPHWSITIVKLKLHTCGQDLHAVDDMDV